MIDLQRKGDEHDDDELVGEPERTREARDCS